MIHLWLHNPTTGLWAIARTCDDDQAQRWLSAFRYDQPNAVFKLAKKRPKYQQNKPGESLDFRWELL